MQATSICSKLRCATLPSAAGKLIKRQQRGANDVQMSTSTSVRQKIVSLGSQDGGTLPFDEGVVRINEEILTMCFGAGKCKMLLISVMIYIGELQKI